MMFVGLAINVTLQEVQESKPTYALAHMFMQRKAEVLAWSGNQVVFGISTDPENYDPDRDAFEYFIGVEISSPQQTPEGMLIREIPTNTYATFTFAGPAYHAGAVHSYFYSTWLRNNSYEWCGRYNIEIYDDRFQSPESEESVTDLCFPIRKKPIPHPDQPDQK